MRTHADSDEEPEDGKELPRLSDLGQEGIPQTAQCTGDGKNRGWCKWFGVTDEYNRRDRVLLMVTYAWTGFWIVIFAIGTVFFLTRGIEGGSGEWARYNLPWARYWEIYMWILIAVSAVVAVWLIAGGIRDVRRLIHTLRTQERDVEDDGWTAPDQKSTR